MGQGAVHGFYLAIKNGLAEIFSDHRLSTFVMEVSGTDALLSPKSVADVLKGTLLGSHSLFPWRAFEADGTAENHIDGVLKARTSILRYTCFTGEQVGFAEASTG